MILTINAQKRDKADKLKALRKAGFLPAVYYGRQQKSTPIQIKRGDFLKVWKNAGESTIIRLHTSEKDLETLIHDVDLDPLSGIPCHADFYVFEKGHKVEISVPLEFDGVSSAVKDFGGVLVKVLHELKIKAEPTNLPREIKVDISVLTDLNSQILAKDLKLPYGVELVENSEEVIAAISEQKEEKEEAILVDLSEIEVEKKGKKDEKNQTEENISKE